MTAHHSGIRPSTGVSGAGRNQPGRVRSGVAGVPSTVRHCSPSRGLGMPWLPLPRRPAEPFHRLRERFWTERTSRDGPNGWSRAHPQQAESEVVRLTWGAPLGTSALRLRPGGGRCATRLRRGRGPEFIHETRIDVVAGDRVEVADLAVCGADVFLVDNPVGRSWVCGAHAGSTDPDPLAPKQRVGVRTRARLAHGGTGRQALDSRPQRELWAEPLMALVGRLWGCGRESIRREAYLQAQGKWGKRERAASQRHSSRG